MGTGVPQKRKKYKPYPLLYPHHMRDRTEQTEFPFKSIFFYSCTISSSLLLWTVEKLEAKLYICTVANIYYINKTIPNCHISVYVVSDRIGRVRQTDIFVFEWMNDLFNRVLVLFIKWPVYISGCNNDALSFVQLIKMK